MSWNSQPRERKKGKVGRKPGKGKERGKGKGDPAIAGRSVATKRKAAKVAGRKGPTNGITGGSSGSCRRHAQREKQPGQRLTYSLSSEISDSGNEGINKRGIGGNTRWETNKQRKRKEEAQAP